MILYTYSNSPLGDMLLISNGLFLTGLFFKGQKYEPKIFSNWRQDAEHKVFVQAIAELYEYFNGSRNQFDIPVKITSGTIFQQQVWRAIAQVPHGKTISYRELAKMAGSPTGIRAVAAATGKNPLSIIIPCHRIIGQNGSLTGYAGGLHRKSALITLEQMS